MIYYDLSIKNPAAHLLEIRCTIDLPDTGAEGPQAFRFPTWTPGSYLIREFARHVVEARAEQAGQRIPLEKTDKQTWAVSATQPGKPLSVIFVLHAWDLSVRGALLDTSHAFLNGSAVFPEWVGHAQESCQLRIDPVPLPGQAPWVVHTSMPRLQSLSGASRDLPLFRLEDYAELIDHPIEMGEAGQYAVLQFSAAGIPHQMVLRGAGDFDPVRLQCDLEKICATVQGIFGSSSPFDHYTFLVTLTGDGYGGLEHRNSTALLASRDDLPAVDLGLSTPAGDGYALFLALCAHEYFHAWLVKRICDQTLVSSTLQAEAYTPLLWFFEGFTSYYDTLILARSGVISQDHYLRLLEKSLRLVSSIPAQHHQSVSESSRDAWIKFYRPDDNTPNSVVSYYTKGSLITLGLDLQLRAQGLSADGWLQGLWVRFGLPRIPVTEESLFADLAAYAGNPTAAWLKAQVQARTALDLSAPLATVGVIFKPDAQPSPRSREQWGFRFKEEGGGVRISHIIQGTAFADSGLASGDFLIAIDGFRVTPGNLETRLQRIAVNKSVKVHAFRDDRLMTVDLAWRNPDARLTWPSLSFDNNPTFQQFSQRGKWLGVP